MEITTKDISLFTPEHKALREAMLLKLNNGEMLTVDVEYNDLKRTRSLITSISRKYEITITTRYKKDEEKLYITIEDIRLRDYNLAIDVLSKYAEMTDIVDDIKEKRNGILQHKRNINHTKN